MARRAPYRRSSPLRRVGRSLLVLLYAAGGLSGALLLLSALGVVPDLRPSAADEDPPTVAASAQVETAADPTAPLDAVRLPLDALDGAADAVRGHDAVVVPMKDPDGTLGWMSEEPRSLALGLSSGTPGRDDALRALTATPELYTVAELSCLRDDALARAAPELALLRENGAPWRDAAGLCWLDPAQEAVRDRLIALCRELADLGFDELLLADLSMPTEGAVERIRPDAGRAEALEALARAIGTALADRDVTVSVVGVPDGGQSTGLLAACGRVWAKAEDAAALAAFAPSVVP